MLLAKVSAGELIFPCARLGHNNNKRGLSVRTPINTSPVRKPLRISLPVEHVY